MSAWRPLNSEQDVSSWPGCLATGIAPCGDAMRTGSEVGGRVLRVDWSAHTLTSLVGEGIFIWSTYETRRVIISRCLSVTVRFEYWVGLHDLVFQRALRVWEGGRRGNGRGREGMDGKSMGIGWEVGVVWWIENRTLRQFICWNKGTAVDVMQLKSSQLSISKCL